MSKRKASHCASCFETRAEIARLNAEIVLKRNAEAELRDELYYVKHHRTVLSVELCRSDLRGEHSKQEIYRLQTVIAQFVLSGTPTPELKQFNRI